ncbi:MAG: glutathione S-transferase N-terminal domain-containing protein [Myxococcales bacterium]|nr:glutathione S-transferase N-terminal domain-containing protein [Myxococcales bacterium]
MQLIGLPYSPWSERARFALDVRHVAYTFRSYQPLLGEPRLRLLTGKWRGHVTVPVLRDGKLVLSDSGAIARHADEHGDGPRLFPGPGGEVAPFEALADRGLAAGRALSLARMLDDDAALAEMVPRALRKVLGPLAVGIGKAGVRRTFRKYGCDARPLAEHRAELESVLEALRAALARSASQDEPRTLLPAFSYADITMAQALAFVEPPSTGLRLGRASRRAFSDPELRARYADLVAWRDALYARWRSA